MYGVILLPHFHLQAVLRRRLEAWRDPVVMLDTVEVRSLKDRGKARVIALTLQAEAEGVEMGMTASQAQARCGRLQLLTREPEEEDAAQADLLGCAGRFTPDFEETRLGICTLDLFGAGLSGEAFAEDAREILAAARLQARIGVAHNPDLALLTAKIADPVRIMPREIAEIQAELGPLPVSILEPGEALAEILRLWGIRRVRDLLALPRDELAERLGPEATALWDRASGREFRLLKLVREPRVFVQEMELDYQVESLEPLLFLLRRMLETLVTRLASAHLVAGRLILQLRLDSGPSYQREFRVPDPCRDLEILTRILHTHLEGFTAPSPIIAVRLEALPSRAVKQQFRLFESGFKDPNRFAETLARLEALLGTERVGSPLVIDTHRPDAIEVRPFQWELGSELGPLSSEEPFRLGPPLKRFRPPIPVQVCSQQQQGREQPVNLTGGRWKSMRILESQGPWVLSGDWWEVKGKAWSRLEWDARLASGELCRLAKCQRRWFMDGIYG